GPERLAARRHDLLARELRLEEAHLAGVEEAIDVLAQAEDVRPPIGSLVGTNALEGSQPGVERMCEDVDFGGIPVHEVTVEPDLLHLVDHARVSLSSALGRTITGI